MEILINVVLPLSLAIIMLSLGLGLTFGDFRRVLNKPLALAIGAFAQLILLPLTAFVVIAAFEIEGEIAVGFMLLSFCPGGVTSNMITKLAKGDVALSVSLTAVISLLSLITVPVLAATAVAHFLGAQAPDITVTELAIAVFLITTLPVVIGVSIRRFAKHIAAKIEPALSVLSTVLFAVIVLAALASSWTLFMDNLATLGPALITMNLSLMLLGLGFALIAGLAWQEIKTISIETGVQNATLGIALAAIISGQTEGFSTMALPSAVYGILMYLIAMPFVAWFRRT